MIDESKSAVSSSFFDSLFVQVNASASTSRGEGSTLHTYNHLRLLNRQEYLQVLLHTAVARYINAPPADRGRAASPGAALRALLGAQFAEALPRLARYDADAFRDLHLYTEATDRVLTRHRGLLLALFNLYAVGDGAIGDALRSRDLLGWDEYQAMIQDLELLDSQFTQLNMALSFSWSRLRVIDETTERARAKQLQLSFEDFLEAFSRVASMKALPTDEDIRNSNSPDAGGFLLRLRAVPNELSEFLRLRAPAWENGESLPQPLNRSIDHLVSYVVRLSAATKAGEGGADGSNSPTKNGGGTVPDGESTATSASQTQSKQSSSRLRLISIAVAKFVQAGKSADEKRTSSGVP